MKALPKSIHFYTLQQFIISQIRQLYNIILTISMFDSPIFTEEEPFSGQLLYSLTAQCFTMTQMLHLYQQTELLKQLTSHMEKSISTRTTIDDEKEIDQTRSQLEISIAEEGSQQEKVTLLSDCKIRRIQEDDEVLKQIQKKCSSNCYARVKEAFDSLKQQGKICKQLESEIELNRKININLLQFKQENDYLRTELEKAIANINSKYDERDKLKVLEERNMNKQSSLLKSEKSLVLKEKRILEMRKKVQSIYETVSRELQNFTSQAKSFMKCYKELNKDNLIDQKRLIDDKSQAILKMWQQFEKSFKSKLQ